MELSEFKKEIKKTSQTRVFDITGSLGVYDAYKWIRKNKWLDIERPLTENEFYSIIRTVNNYLAEELSQGEDITLPEKMGRIELRKTIPNIRFVDGKLRVPLPIDWNKTLELWYNDPEAKENKSLVKIPEKEIFKFLYNRYNANYPNKAFFNFRINRKIKLKVKEQIQQGNIDTFLRYD